MSATTAVPRLLTRPVVHAARPQDRFGHPPATPVELCEPLPVHRPEEAPR